MAVARMTRIHTVHIYSSQVGVERVQLVDDFVGHRLAETAQLTANAENQTELATYRSLRGAGDKGRMEVDAVADLITAALRRRNGLPPFFGIDWLPDMATTPDVRADLRTTLDGRNLVRGLRPR